MLDIKTGIEKLDTVILDDGSAAPTSRARRRCDLQADTISAFAPQMQHLYDGSTVVVGLAVDVGIGTQPDTSALAGVVDDGRPA